MEAIAFLLILLTQVANTEFIVQPQDQDQVVGAQTLFRCQYNASSNNDLPHHLGWLVNNRSINRYRDPCICKQTTTGGGMFENMTIVSTLCITAAIECDGTQVQCVIAIIFNDNEPMLVHSEVATLYVRSILGSVIDLSTTVIGNSILVTWEAPFMLNITNTEPDVTYCISVSSDNHDNVESLCSITAMEFLYNVTHQNYCSETSISIAVVPVNGAGYGTPTAVKFQYNEFEILPEIMQSTTETMELRLQAKSVLHECHCWLLLWTGKKRFEFTDFNGLSCDSTLSALNFSSSTLPFNSHYEGGFYIASTVSYIKLSTYDIQTVNMISGQEQNSLRFRLSYIKGSKAQGALISIVPIFETSTLLPISKIIPYSSKDIVVSEIPAGVYKVLIYDIEEDGLLAMPFVEPAIIRTAVVPESTVVPSTTLPSKGMPNNCLVILRLNQHPERLNVRLHPINSPYPLEYNVEAEARYTITVFTVSRNSILNSTIMSVQVLIGPQNKNNLDVYKIVSGAGLSISAMVIILLIITFILIKAKTHCGTCTMHNSKDVEEANIEMQNCEAYETINAVKQRRAVVHGQSNTQSQW